MGDYIRDRFLKLPDCVSQGSKGHEKGELVYIGLERLRRKPAEKMRKGVTRSDNTFVRRPSFGGKGGILSKSRKKTKRGENTSKKEGAPKGRRKNERMSANSPGSTSGQR